MRNLISATVALLAMTAAAFAAPVEQGPPNVAAFKPAFDGQTRVDERLSGVTPQVDIFATGLARPWGIAPLPSGGYLVTERPGRLRVVSDSGAVSPPLSGVPDVLAAGQGGLLDVALDPAFSESRMVYLTYSKPVSGGRVVTAVGRGVLSADLSGLADFTDIFVQSPPSPTAAHFGSRIVFDADGFAFVTLGEHSSRRERELAQDLSTTYGKVIRIEKNGTVPAQNPFVGQHDARPEIWSYGHRNPQGAAFEPATGALWTVEHGPAGGDELNRPQAGRNYGWPVISYGQNYNGTPVGAGRTAAAGMEQPVYYWDPVIAPGGMAFYQGDLFAPWQGDLLIGSLNPGGLVRLDIEDGRVVGEERFLRGAGRVRDVEVAPDGSVLLLIDAERGEIWRLRPGE